MTKTQQKKDDFLDLIPDFKIPKPGELVEGKVIAIHKNKILVDIDSIATGIIAGKEAKDSMDTIKDLKSGDTISAYVIEGENEEGYIVMSLRKASQEKTWKAFLDAYENDKEIEVYANEANKGGLLLDIDGIKGFIPVSQLAPMHYPRVNGADSNQILNRLQELVGQKFRVKIINIDKENGKLILSEKAAIEEQRQTSLDQLNIGDVVEGKISGIVKFGIFVAFNGLEGLVHISEIAWGHVKSPNDYGKLGDPVKVQVIGLDGDKISLSMKRLTDDPWLEAAKKYQEGSIIKGEINRVTPFGAFMKLADDINGLIHVTEIDLKDGQEPGDVLNVGDKVKAKVIAIEPEEHRVGLSLKDVEENNQENANKEEKSSKKAKKSEEESE
ncbi:S1 RNA-binding domain-containing protein [Candidatus Peregrinibacteria bacterium]|nr:S1 RNA-binding domain-containing protein [Candidatus Peregrinibacteria bacterium]